MTEQTELKLLLKEEKLLTNEIADLEERLFIYKSNLAEVKARVNTLKAESVSIINQWLQTRVGDLAGHPEFKKNHASKEAWSEKLVI